MTDPLTTVLVVRVTRQTGRVVVAEIGGFVRPQRLTFVAEPDRRWSLR